MLRVSAETFLIHPGPDAIGNPKVGHKADVYTPLKSSLLLLEDDGQRVALMTTHVGNVLAPRVSRLFRGRVAAALGLGVERVLLFSSHNHCSPVIPKPRPAHWIVDTGEEAATESDLTDEGRALLEGWLAAAARAPGGVQEAEVRWGLGHERRISHNRKGRRADGSTYMMREADRLRLGVDFCGDIDDDAPLVGFFNRSGEPIAFLAQFTAHPVTAYHCEKVLVHGEYPQVACDDLSAAFGGAPVAFVQGCAGDVNSKGLLSESPPEENVANAERFGHFLGETYLRAAGSMARSSTDTLGLAWRKVALPFRPLFPLRRLERRLKEVEAFQARCEAGDEPGTRECDGLNFPVNMTPDYRGRVLIEPTRRWLLWAMRFHREGRLDEAPKGVFFDVAALRVGDVGLVGLPCEPFLGIGRQIKRDSPLSLTIPCGYMNDTRYNYVPDGPNCADTEYMSSFYRYRIGLLPYRKPAGDRLARAGAEMLKRL